MRAETRTSSFKKINQNVVFFVRSLFLTISQSIQFLAGIQLICFWGLFVFFSVFCGGFFPPRDYNKSEIGLRATVAGNLVLIALLPNVT